MEPGQFKDYLPYAKLKDVADSLSDKYSSATPWPHIVLDDFFDEEILDAILKEIEGAQGNKNWREFESKYEKKLQLNKDEEFGPVTRSFLHALNSQPFLDFLSKATGIERLVPDAYFEGGGYHQIPRGGKLGVHVDFNKNEQMGLYRRLNLIIYLNKNWDEEFGGHFQLWDKKTAKCEKRVLPKFNRAAIFGTTQHSFHGHPEPLNCPDGTYRRSLALYYYSPAHGDQKVKPHSTLFLTENGKTEELFAKKSIPRRVVSKVKKLLA